MKVVCIHKAEYWSDDGLGKTHYGPKYGDIINVTETIERGSRKYYRLEEYPNRVVESINHSYIYNTKWFIEVSILNSSEVAKVIHHPILN